MSNRMRDILTTRRATFTLPQGSLYSWHCLTVRIELRQTGKGPELSFSGEERYRTKASRQVKEGSWGQCLDLVPDTEDEKGQTIRALWQRWHLNGMRSGCEHQRAAGWRICPGHYHTKGPWLDKGRKAKDPMPEGWRVESEDDGIMILHKLYVTITNCDGVKEERQGEELQQRSWCSLDTLGKPCLDCGYKMGTAWLYEAIPMHVLEVLDRLTGPPLSEGPGFVATLCNL